MSLSETVLGLGQLSERKCAGHTLLLRMKEGPDCLLPRAVWSPEGFVWGWLQGYPMQSPRLGDTLWRWPSWVPIPSLHEFTSTCEISGRICRKDRIDCHQRM